MNNSVCDVCGKEFEFGVDGINHDDELWCDSCARIIRTADGEISKENGTYVRRRKNSSAYSLSTRACRGDFFVTPRKRA